MPRTGFKTITVSETIYDKFHDIFLKNKDYLAMKGINSFSGYVTYILEQMMEKDKMFTQYAPKIEKISVNGERIILKDNIKNRIVEVTLSKDGMLCQLCEANDCVHIGFVFSLPSMYL